MSGVHPSRTVGAPSYWSEMCHKRTYAASELHARVPVCKPSSGIFTSSVT